MITLELLTTEQKERPVFIAGNFNNWQAADPAYKMTHKGEGRYQFIFKKEQELPETLEYKYTRGDWQQVELDKYGNSINNRSVIKKQQKVVDKVPHWQRNGLNYSPQYLPRIEVISESFEIPQLIKTRRIAALLPSDYHDHPDRRYPVVYLQDGQNLFDDHAPFGNWAVDKRLAVLKELGRGDIIIISIDHGADQRIEEFTPSHYTKLGVGDGKKYVRFLTDTLKPYVDSHFRTKRKREFTAIGGSSMGGLISMYAGLIYPEVYSKQMIFSPSLWVDPNISMRADEYFATFDTKIYIYAGERESPAMVPYIQRFKSALEKNRIDEQSVEFKLCLDPEGEHNERRWGAEFPKAISWLFD